MRPVESLSACTRVQFTVTLLSNNPNCRKCGAEEEISGHILCECEALASLRHYTSAFLFFLDTEDIRKLSIEAFWNFTKTTGLLYLSLEYGG